MRIIPTRATRTLARRIIDDVQEHGTAAVIRHLGDVDPEQLAALVATLAEAACVRRGIPAPTKQALTEARGAAWRARIAADDAEFADPEDRKRAHTAWNQGSRTDWATRGERAYQRAKQRERRTARKAA